MYEPIMVPPRNPRRTIRTVLVVVGVVLVVCCLGGVIGGLWFVNTARDELPQIRSAASSYLDAAQAGDVGSAYGQLCESFRSRVSQDSFAARTRPLRSYEIIGVRIENTNGHTRGFVSTHLTLADGTQSDQVFPLVKEDGHWRVCDS